MTTTKLFTKAEVLGCITGRALYMDDPCCKALIDHIVGRYPSPGIKILSFAVLIQGCQGYLASNFVLLHTLAKQLEKHYGEDTSKWCEWYETNADWLINEYVEVGQL